MAQYADLLFMSINGVPVEIMEFSSDPTFDSREAVATMNPTGRPLGIRRKVGECTFTVKVPVRAGLPAWNTIEGATVRFMQRVTGAPSFTAQGAFYKSHKYGTDTEGDQVVDVEFGCLDWKEGQ